MLPSPGQQRAQLVDFGFARDDAFEDIAQISERLDMLSFAVWISEAITAQLSAPPSEPAKRWFLAPSLIGRMVRSTVFESISTRPSFRNTPSPFQWRRAYLI